MALVPLSTVTAASSPSCTLTVTTPQGDVTIRNTPDAGTVFVRPSDEVRIAWKSTNAKTASDRDGDTIPLSGSVTEWPEKTTTYSYTFKSGARTATCSVTAQVVNATIDAESLSTTSTKPTITGTAVGAKTLYLTVRREGQRKVLYQSKAIMVKNEKWKTTFTKRLPKGRFEITVTGDKKAGLNTVAKGMLLIGLDVAETPKVPTTFIVSNVPLLTGGIARAGTSVPVSYLQITNVGSVPATVKGFWVRQTGTAPTQAVIGLTTIDDKGGSQGSTNIREGSSPFSNGMALAPTDAIFLPGQMRLFTIKAVITSNAAAYQGTQLVIDVPSIDSNATTVRGAFPIRGTTWTIAP
jgi:hypothetical protein